MNKAASSALIFLAGVTTGALLGVLYAPDEGVNTRNKLSYQLSSKRDKLLEIINRLRAQQLPNAAKTESQRVIDDAREQAEKLLNDVEALMGQIKGGNV